MKNFEIIANLLKEIWPEHHAKLTSEICQLSSDDAFLLDYIAEKIILIKKDKLKQAIKNYKQTCAVIVQEEIHFRRTQSYRLKTEQQADTEIYSNSSFMDMYLDGLLISQLFWSNHFKVFQFFCSSFLTQISKDDTLNRFVEIGPGHGLFLSEIVKKLPSRECLGYDISESSLRHTSQALQSLECAANVQLINKDIYNLPTDQNFDAIILSEVLEHLEAPQEILTKLSHHLTPKGLLFINVPVCSPAPDHIYLFKTPNEVQDMITSCGFRVNETRYFPMTGYSLERAIKSQATISVAAICQLST
ncbi:hypothetical protein WH96_20150 [Kiloniella spongiae]|uniref:Methyltransferase type 12 domain-containing protein n=1 Tax=Kiloniella spongiae TaxID=1489064 RepID=A0A0H2M9J2_9PROT|nr:class I SAM-dependent methyltransferase [Kiloniella spongiae]KLN58963.1 hypothetical protein WH96_20150 [Kiloniella spongiae]